MYFERSEMFLNYGLLLWKVEALPFLVTNNLPLLSKFYFIEDGFCRQSTGSWSSFFSFLEWIGKLPPVFGHERKGMNIGQLGCWHVVDTWHIGKIRVVLQGSWVRWAEQSNCFGYSTELYSYRHHDWIETAHTFWYGPCKWMDGSFF